VIIWVWTGLNLPVSMVMYRMYPTVAVLVSLYPALYHHKHF